MTVFAIDYKKNKLRAFKSEKVARNMGEVVLFRDAKELLENGNTTGRGLVEVYNNCVSATGFVKRFSDNKTAAKRIVALAQDIHVESTPFDEVVEEPKVVRTYKLNKPFSAENMGMTVVKAGAKKPRGAFTGKKIKCLVDVNPRKEGTRGWNNFSLFLGHGTISYEDFVELAAGHGSTKGGCREDLAHDIKKGRVELV
tara:strand:- start:143 stop:736 length:594 start_codon:yes stop_codon:yes gene_type:complete